MSIKVRVDLTTVAGQVLHGYINVGAEETLYRILRSDIGHVEWIALNGEASLVEKATIRNLRLVSPRRGMPVGRDQHVRSPVSRI